ncbi:hypothetical protein FACS1894184_14080 [Clostridia bacterium]|nr:hypothetical protein FACS1894184_14080 [Clostridia bacterium]
MNVQSMVVEVVAIITVAIITRYLVPWIKAHTTDAQQHAINTALDSLVEAAEQIYGTKNGAQKYAAVLQWANTRGIQAGREDIESAVYRLRASEVEALEYESDEMNQPDDAPNADDKPLDED